jgi:hypothetical protein
MIKSSADAALVAYCGLYCGACPAYLKGRCPGCRNNTKATWCKLRSCCIDQGYQTCADCSVFTNVNDCKKFNNIISTVVGFLFRSNRKACIDQIQTEGLDGHALIMAQKEAHTLKR